MKKLLILLMCLSGCGNCDENSHTKKITNITEWGTYTICVNGIEYVEYSASAKGGITLSVDKDGKPKQCNY